MKNSAKLVFITWFLLLIVIVVFGSGFYYLYSRIDQQSTDSIEPVKESSVIDREFVSEDSDTCGPDCLAEIERIVNEKLSSKLKPTQAVVEKITTVIQESSGTSYIPMGNAGATTSTDWVDVEGAVVYINLENDYRKGSVVSWEASLKVAHGNGKAFARLYDDTNKIAVDFSELSSENNSSFKQVISGNLPLWRGNNLYKVQIKSLNSFEVTYSGGRIKISY
ncbi:MAG: hypothetical protein ACC618_02715 [Patescibacteria group bacterium]